VPYFLKLTKPLSDLFAPRPVSGNHSFNCDGFLIALHCSLSIARFYEPAGIIVNEEKNFESRIANCEFRNFLTNSKFKIRNSQFGVMMWRASPLRAGASKLALPHESPKMLETVDD